MALTLNQLEKLLEQNQLISLFNVLLINTKLSSLFNFEEPEDVILPMEKNEGLKICLGFTPTRMIKPGRILPEPENNPVSPNIRTINIVTKILVQDQYTNLSEHTTNMSDLGLLNTNIGNM